MAVLDLIELEGMLKNWEFRQLKDLDLLYQHAGAPDLEQYLRDFERIQAFSDKVRRVFREARECLLVIEGLCRAGRDAVRDETHEIASKNAYFDSLVRCHGKDLPEPVAFYPDEPFVCPACNRVLVVRVVPIVHSEDPRPLKLRALTGSN